MDEQPYSVLTDFWGEGTISPPALVFLSFLNVLHAVETKSAIYICKFPEWHTSLPIWRVFVSVEIGYLDLCSTSTELECYHCGPSLNHAELTHKKIEQGFPAVLI